MSMAHRRSLRRFEPAAVPPPLGPRLRAALAREHARRPFTPCNVREAARRVAVVARRLDADAVIVRGGLDLGGAELDHVWVVVADRVVDVAMPVNSAAFVDAVRAYVAGDLASRDLDHVAHGYHFAWRVVGEFQPPLRYFGEPVLSQR